MISILHLERELVKEARKDPQPAELVESFDGREAICFCQGCEHVWALTSREIGEGGADAACCPRCLYWGVEYRYVPGEKCANCERLDYAHEFEVKMVTSGKTVVKRRVCSRLCRLQWEYGQQLAVRQAA